MALLNPSKDGAGLANVGSAVGTVVGSAVAESTPVDFDGVAVGWAGLELDWQPASSRIARIINRLCSLMLLINFILPLEIFTTAGEFNHRVNSPNFWFLLKQLSRA